MTKVQVKSQGLFVRPSNFPVWFLHGIVMVIVALTAYPTHAQESVRQAISNVELEYTYSDGGAVVLKIGEGKLGYRWIAGPSAGYEVTNRLYQSRKISPHIYLVTWHDSENRDYVNLVIDMSTMVVHGSALAAYGSESPFVFFDKAEIARVAWVEK
jgi:hypothetical protein